MIQALVTAAAGLAAGLFAGGCTGRGKVTETLLQRNANLETQVSTSHDIITSMAVTVVLLGCGLGASAFGHIRKRKGNKLGPRRRKTRT